MLYGQLKIFIFREGSSICFGSNLGLMSERRSRPGDGVRRMENGVSLSCSGCGDFLHLQTCPGRPLPLSFWPCCRQLPRCQRGPVSWLSPHRQLLLVTRFGTACHPPLPPSESPAGAIRGQRPVPASARGIRPWATRPLGERVRLTLPLLDSASPDCRMALG